MFIEKLSMQQTAVAGLVAQGFDNSTIAWLLCISKGTLERHIQMINRKLEKHFDMRGRNYRTSLAYVYFRAMYGRSF